MIKLDMQIRISIMYTLARMNACTYALLQLRLLMLLYVYASAYLVLCNCNCNYNSFT